MMTRKHFELFAEAVSLIENKARRRKIAKKAIELFEKENPLFDKERFLEACGL